MTAASIRCTGMQPLCSTHKAVALPGISLTCVCCAGHRFELYSQCKVGTGTSFMVTSVDYKRTKGAKRNYWVKVCAAMLLSGIRVVAAAAAALPLNLIDTRQVVYPFMETESRPLKAWEDKWLPESDYGTHEVLPNRCALCCQPPTFPHINVTYLMNLYMWVYLLRRHFAMLQAS